MLFVYVEFISVANSWQTFRPVWQKNSTAEKKIWLPNKFYFLKVFGHMENYIVAGTMDQ
jgi:hypothetical protein